MKKHKKMTVVTAAAAVLAVALRLWQRLTGFEEGTELAVSGHPAGICLPVVLVLTAAALVWLARELPGEWEQRPFLQVFGTGVSTRLMPVVMGVFLMAGSGLMQILFALAGNGMYYALQGDGMLALIQMSEVSPSETLLVGLTAVVSGVCLFPAAVACRRATEEEGVNGVWLLIPVIAMVVRLVLLYRVHSVNPVLQAYYVELLAVVCTAVAIYQLAGFVFGQGAPRWYSISSGLAVVLCAAAMADGQDLPGVLFYAGCVLSVLGFWGLYTREDPQTEE